MSLMRRARRSLSLELVVLVLVLVLAGCQSVPAKRPPPSPFTWRPTAAPSVTAQQALAADLRDLQLCFSGPATALTTTWVVTGPTYGLAVLVADCQTDPHDTRQGLAFLTLGVDTPDQPRCPHWQLIGPTLVDLRPPPDPPTDVLAQVPAWLPLPPDHYLTDPLGGGQSPPAAGQMWLSATREFVAGRFRAVALRPPNARALTTSEPAGWLDEEHGLASVVLPQPGGWTFFFAGTAAPGQVEDLARRTLPHVDELLPWPQPRPADSPAPTPAC